MNPADRGRRLTATDFIALMNAAGLDLKNPYDPRYDETAHEEDEELARSHHLIGTIGLRIQQLVDEFWLNAEIEQDRTSLAEDIALLRTAGIVAAADRICARTCGARDLQDAGLNASERDRAEEALARWFETEWTRFLAARLPPGESAGVLMTIISEAERRAASIPNPPRGQPQKARSVTRLIQQLSEIHHLLTGTAPATSKASGDRADGALCNGYERATSFLRFLDAISTRCALPEIKPDAVRTALARMPAEGK